MHDGMRLIVIIVYLQDARWQDAAKTEACLAGIDNRRPSQKQ